MIKKYEEYKESGTSFGLIPKAWDYIQFRYCFELNKGLNITKENLIEKGIPCVNYGEIHSKLSFQVNPDVDELKCVSEEYLESNEKSLLAYGDFVFADTSEDIEGSGNFTYLNSEKAVFAGYHTIIAKPISDFNIRYLAYLIDSIQFRRQIQSQVKGVKVFSITNKILKETQLLSPSLPEQTQIASYLDHQTALIDALIAKKEALIEKLKLQRQAVINEAVTRGLDENVKLVDSGVEWLGEIPEGWEVVKLKRIASVAFSSVDRHEYEDELKVFICHYPQAYKNEKITDEIQLSYGTCSELEFERFRLKKGQIIITKDSESASDIGVPTYITKDFDSAVCGYHLAMIETDENEILGEYLFRFLQTRKVQGYFETNANGVTRFGLGKASIENIDVAIPSLNTQSAIIKLINSKINYINQIVSRTEYTITKLKLYRQSLISEAVTGKVDLREWGK